MMWFWKFPKSDVIRSLHTWPWSPAIGKPGDCMVKRRVEAFGQSIWVFLFIDSWWHRHHCRDEVYVCVCVSRVWIVGWFFGVEPSFWLTPCGGEIYFNLLPSCDYNFARVMYQPDFKNCELWEELVWVLYAGSVVVSIYEKTPFTSTESTVFFHFDEQ